MNFVNTIKQIQHPYVVVMGNFDGVHRGHQFLLAKAQEVALSMAAKLVVVTFYPHPKLFFNPRTEYYIYPRQKNRRRLSQFADYLYEINFNQECAALSPIEFIQQHLDSQNLKGVVIGYDFHFGHQQVGDGRFLQEYCKKNNLSFLQVGAWALNAQVVSSSFIRQLLQKQQFSLMAKLLGEQYHLTGILVQGKGLGKKINFPTLNLQIDAHLLLPPMGVYATYVQIAKKWYPAVTNIGKNPTVENTATLKIESHILKGKVVAALGDNLALRFITYLRPEIHFSSLKKLQQQIALDVEQAKRHLCV